MSGLIDFNRSSRGGPQAKISGEVDRFLRVTSLEEPTGSPFGKMKKRFVTKCRVRRTIVVGSLDDEFVAEQLRCFFGQKLIRLEFDLDSGRLVLESLRKEGDQVLDWRAVLSHPGRGDLERSDQRPQQRRLARPVGSHEHDDGGEPDIRLDRTAPEAWKIGSGSRDA